MEFDQYLADKSVPIQGLARMLTHCNFSYNDVTAGLTWHEIFILSGAISNYPQIFNRSSAVAAKPIYQQVREFAIAATALVKACLNVEGQRYFQITNLGANRVSKYGHIRRLPHTKLAPVLNQDVLKALYFTMLQIDKVLSTAQKAPFSMTPLYLGLMISRVLVVFVVVLLPKRSPNCLNLHIVVI